MYIKRHTIVIYIGDNILVLLGFVYKTIWETYRLQIMLYCGTNSHSVMYRSAYSHY